MSKAHEGSVWTFEVCLSRAFLIYAWLVMGEGVINLCNGHGEARDKMLDNHDNLS